MSVDCVVVGAGGHAAVVIDALRLGEIWRLACVTDACAEESGASVLGVRVEGDDESAERLRDRGITHFVLGVSAVRDNGARRRLSEHYVSIGLEPATVVYPDARIADRAVVGAGAVVLGDVRLGETVVGVVRASSEPRAISSPAESQR